METLNVRLQWQQENPERGLIYVPLELKRTKIYIFTDGSFANNKDFTSQLGFIIVLATETSRTEADFEILGNIIHWSSTKCKRVTRSVLASELYGMMTGFDSGIALSTTINKIMDCLAVPRIPVVICSDSRSLYECLVKLGTTDEKRLMIDIMSLRESYERKEISEIRWIDGRDNPADACTKKTPNKGQVCLENITSFYPGSKKVIVTDLSLTIKGGAKVALVGPSGTGKSTLLKLVSRQLLPTKGRILIDDQDIAGLSWSPSFCVP